MQQCDRDRDADQSLLGQFTHEEIVRVHVERIDFVMMERVDSRCRTADGLSKLSMAMLQNSKRISVLSSRLPASIVVLSKRSIDRGGDDRGQDQREQETAARPSSSVRATAAAPRRRRASTRCRRCANTPSITPMTHAGDAGDQRRAPRARQAAPRTAARTYAPPSSRRTRRIRSRRAARTCRRCAAHRCNASCSTLSCSLQVTLQYVRQRQQHGQDARASACSSR